MNEPVADPAKVKRYTRLAIISAFLLALLWPIGGYFFWILGGCITYFLFLVWFYSPRVKKRETEFRQTRQTNPSQKSSTPDEAKRKNQAIAFIVLATMIVTMIMALIMSLDDDENESAAEEVFSDVNSIDGLTNLGNDFYNQGKYDSALVYYEKALTMDPDNQANLYNKALAYYAKEDYRKSISIVRYCLDRYPQYGYAYYLLGDDYRAIDKIDTALICFEKAYEFEVRDFDLLENLGDVHLQKGNTTQAVKYYREAIGEDSTQVQVYKQLLNIDRSNQELYRRQIEKYDQ